MTLPETISALRELRAKSGYSKFEIAVKTLNRERVNPEREKRQRFPPQEYDRLYGKQRGICPGYGVPEHPFEGSARDQHIDHIDSQRTHGYNAKSNRQLLCGPCNLRKSSKSIYAQSKHSGRPFTDIIGGASEDLD